MKRLVSNTTAILLGLTSVVLYADKAYCLAAILALISLHLFMPAAGYEEV